MKILNVRKLQRLLNVLSLLLLHEAEPRNCPPLSYSDTSRQGVEPICKYQNVFHHCFKENFPAYSVVYFKCKHPTTSITQPTLGSVYPNFMLCMANGTWASFNTVTPDNLNCFPSPPEDWNEEYDSSRSTSQHFKLRSVPWRNDDDYAEPEPEPSRPSSSSTATFAQVNDDSTSEEVNSTPRPLHEMRREIVNYINAYRAKHHAPAVMLNRKMSQDAQRDAEMIIKNNTDLALGQNSEYGQTLFELSKSGEEVKDEEITRGAADKWYESIADYDPQNPRPLAFTQLVWKRSRWVGCGVETRGERTVVLCNFRPPGNIEVLQTDNRWREYQRNVVL